MNHFPHLKIHINSDKQLIIFAHELQSAVILTVFLNTNCELYQICHLNIKLKLK
jgi:hypothetical protein